MRFVATLMLLATVSPGAAAELEGEPFVYTKWETFYAEENGLPNDHIFSITADGDTLWRVEGPDTPKGEPVKVNGAESVGDGGCLRDYVYVGDVAAANVAVLTCGDGEAFNIGTNTQTKTQDLIDKLSSACWCRY